jgi:hypothetical protein
LGRSVRSNEWHCINMFIEELENHRWDDTRDEDAQERAVRLNALCRVYEQADRVLSGDPVIVNVVPDGPAPAWSDGASIYINANQINEVDLETLTQVNGLNYHELAHHLYTPRKGTELVKYLIEQGYFQAFNILEDQRIETLLTGRYPAIAPYLTATVARWLGSSEDINGNYVCIRGRRYLPVEIRQAFRDEFAFPELIPTIIEIVDEYRLLAFPSGYDRAKVLIKRFHEEVVQAMGLPDMDGGPNKCGERSPTSKGRPEPGKAQEKDAARARGIGTRESTYVPKPKQSNEPSSQSNNDGNAQGDQSNTNNPSENGTQSPSTANAPTSIEEALDIREQNVNVIPAAKAGTGHAPSLGGLPDKINDMLNNAIDDVLARKDVQADVKAKQRVIVGGDGKHEDITKRGKFQSTTVPQEAIISYRKFARELQRLRDDSEPTWQRETPSGRLNVQRVIRGCEIDQSFDRWDEGDDGCDIEAVILVDRSGSMSSGRNDQKASVACWTIKRALEHIQAPVTVYAFDDAAEVAYTRNELAHKTEYKFIYGNGGTQPYPTLLAAEQLLMASRKKNKMLFIVTDGVFDTNKNDELIQRIGRRGVLTAMTLIMNDKEWDYYVNDSGQLTEKQLRHEAEVFSRINTAQDLLPFAKQVVVSAIKKRSRMR